MAKSALTCPYPTTVMQHDATFTQLENISYMGEKTFKKEKQVIQTDGWGSQEGLYTLYASGLGNQLPKTV